MKTKIAPSGPLSLLVMTTGEWTSVFDIVGEVQQMLKGNDFYSLAPFSNSSGIWLTPVHWDAMLYFPPRRFEGLLQDIRGDFPGISFQFIDIMWDSNRFRTRITL